MKQKINVVERQNDKEAITYLRASTRCLRNERFVKYIMIFFSFGICLAAIFNRYLPQMMPGKENVTELQETIATYVNLISGVILVAGLVLGFYVTRMHTEGTVLRDRYDSYVFDNGPNHSILRPISPTIVELYAKKTARKADEAFYNLLYSPADTPDAATAQFEYINKEVHSDYKLYLSIQPFFITIWVGFCVLIMIIAVSFNDTFVTTLINIMIPSLSAITTIGNSWYGCRLQMRQLLNLINITDKISAMPEAERLAYITDADKMRALADGLFNYRSSPFVIPNFLVRRFQRMSGMKVKASQTAEEAAVSDASDEAPVKKTERKTAKSVEEKPVNKAQEKPVKTAKPAAETKPAKTVKAAPSTQSAKTTKPAVKSAAKASAEPKKTAATKTAKAAPVKSASTNKKK